MAVPGGSDGRGRASARRPRVAILGTRGFPSYYGGFETAVRKLAPFLADGGCDVVVYCRPGIAEETSSSALRQVFTPGLSTTSLSTLSYGLTSALHALWTRPDAVLVMNCGNGLWLPLLRLRGIPVAVNVDGIEWARAKWGRLARAVFRLGAWMSARFATELIFDSVQIARFWEDRFGRPGTFIPYGGEATIADADANAHWDEAFSPDGYVLLVARFVPENTVREFLQAAPQIAQFADVVLVGGAEPESELGRAAAEATRRHPRIHWVGHLSDDARLHRLWSSSRVYFHGHSVGGTNPALVQAMALGCRIVARDTVYSREVLDDAGWFTQPTADDILATVREAFDVEDDPRPQRALERASDRYSWDVINRQYHAVLEKIAPDAALRDPAR